MRIDHSAAGFRIGFRYDAALVAAVKSLLSRRFDGATKTWTVPSSGAGALRALIARLNGTPIEYGPGAREALDEGAAATVAAVEASRATDWQGDIPCPKGLAYLPFQRAGIAYAMTRPDVLIGDEMGLGKTIQAIGAINADVSIRNVLVICPASLKINWSRELQKWLARPLTIAVANGALPTEDIVVINYDILKKHAAAIQARSWDCLVVDECHYLKNPKAQRTAQVLGKWDCDESKRIAAIQARRRLFLTGTPILNRPIELWPIVHALDASGLGRSWKHYVTRYCAGYQGPHGWDVSGASNGHELQDALRASIMLRRRKAEVLTELPAKRRSVVVLPANGSGAAIAAESAGYAAAQERIAVARVAVELAKAADQQSYESAVEALGAASRVAFTEISALRHAVALAKVPHAIDYVRDLIEAEKVVLFAHHHDVIAAISAEFGAACVTLTGENSQEQRQAAVDRFQSDDSCRLFVGSIHAAGVGLTLTAAAHVVFCELDWVPGNMSQAEDRCHRIGQHNQVLVEHLVLDGSLDVRMAQALVAKQDVIDAALDDTERAELAQISVAPDAPSTASTSRKQIETVAATLTPDQIALIHEGLRMLAGRCDGAATLDGAGYNKLDTAIGHSLAARDNLTPKQAALGQRLCHKYRRQLPARIAAA